MNAYYRARIPLSTGEENKHALKKMKGWKGFRVSIVLRHIKKSLVVRKGCVLEVFKESDCTGAKYTFRAESDEDLIVEELDESDAEDFVSLTT